MAIDFSNTDYFGDVDFTRLQPNWDEAYHHTGEPIPPNAFMYGLVILDWDGSFKKRLRRFETNDIKIPFQYLENVPVWQKSANYNEIGDIMGRFEPVNVYSNSGGQDFTLTLIYNAEAMSGGVGVSTKWTLERIEQLVKRIQSLVFPIYSEGNYGPPPKLLMNIGNIYQDVPILIKNCIVESMEPFHVTTGLPLTRKITLECRITYPSWQGISCIDVWTSYEGGAGTQSGETFAYETLNDKYRPGNRGGSF